MKLSLRAYVEEPRCPECHSSHIDANARGNEGIEIDYPFARVYSECEECKHVWDELYVLCGYQSWPLPDEED